MATGGVFDDDKCIYMGGLRRDLDRGRLKRNIQTMFRCMNISVDSSNIRIINKADSDYSFGFVELQNANTVNYVLHQLRPSARANIQFDFSQIVDQNKEFRVDHKKSSKQPLYSSLNTGNNMNNGEKDSALVSAEVSVVPLSKPAKTPVQNTNGQPSLSSLSGRYYTLGDHLGNETRTLEFKRGGFLNDVDKNILKDTIGKYVCAFLNTDGGTLLIGVSDDGKVLGVNITQQEEDAHRLTIDKAIRMITPTLLPGFYTVQFVPVLDQNYSFSGGDHLDVQHSGFRQYTREELLLFRNMMDISGLKLDVPSECIVDDSMNTTTIRERGNLKVLEVKVEAITDHLDLYEYRGETFIRREGGVQLLMSRDKQDLIRQRLEHHKFQKEELLQKLVVQTEKVQDLQQQVTKLEADKQQQQLITEKKELQQKNQVLEREKRERKDEKKKSKLCTVQ